jgi:hypothetical protein
MARRAYGSAGHLERLADFPQEKMEQHPRSDHPRR